MLEQGSAIIEKGLKSSHIEISKSLIQDLIEIPGMLKGKCAYKRTTIVEEIEQCYCIMRKYHFNTHVDIKLSQLRYYD